MHPLNQWFQNFFFGGDLFWTKFRHGALQKISRKKIHKKHLFLLMISFYNLTEYKAFNRDKIMNTFLYLKTKKNIMNVNKITLLMRCMCWKSLAMQGFIFDSSGSALRQLRFLS